MIIAATSIIGSILTMNMRYFIYQRRVSEIRTLNMFLVRETFFKKFLDFCSKQVMCTIQAIQTGGLRY